MPPNTSLSASQFLIVPAQDTQTARVVRSQQKIASWLVTFYFLFVVASLPLLFYTCWIVLEAAVRAWHLPHTPGILTSLLGRSRNMISPGGWPFDVAFLFSTLTAWGMLYLGYDHLSLFGNRRIKTALLRKAKGIYPYTLAENPHFFVEVRPPDDAARTSRDRLTPDVGWLFLTPDALVFAGNEQVVTIPRERILQANRSVTSDIARYGLSASWVRLPYGSRRTEIIHLMARDDAERHSETGPGARRLAKALNEWLRRQQGN
jgi:hypothetical protein